MKPETVVENPLTPSQVHFEVNLYKLPLQSIVSVLWLIQNEPGQVVKHIREILVALCN